MAILDVLINGLALNSYGFVGNPMSNDVTNAYQNEIAVVTNGFLWSANGIWTDYNYEFNRNTSWDECEICDQSSAIT